MELRLVMRVLLRRWWLVILPFAVAVLVVAPDLMSRGLFPSGGYTTVVRYTAAQVLDPVLQRGGDYQGIWLASESIVNAMTDWVRSSRFASEVAAKAAERGLNVNPVALQLAGDRSRSVGQLFVSWHDADELAVIVDAAIEVLTTRSQDYFPQLNGLPAQVRILDDPRITPVPPPLVDRFAPYIRLGLALLVGIGLAFLADYLDPTLRNREEVEALGLLVIASIPRR